MNNDKTSDSAKRIEIAIGERGDKFERKYPELVAVNPQPAGLTFYKIAWNGVNRGTLHIDAGRHGFDISNVINVVGTEDVDHKSEGISHISVISDITGPNGLSHDRARDKIYEIFNVLRRAGWRATVPFGVPRLSGRDMLEYHLKCLDTTTLDPAYKPSLEEWMRLEDFTAWEFYADGVFLEATFMRDASHLDVAKPGFYILNLVLRSDVEYFKEFVGPESRDRWVDLLPSELQNLASRRKIKENELSGTRVTLNREYIDPPLPAAATKKQ